jgi:hypothetical protein
MSFGMRPVAGPGKQGEPVMAETPQPVATPGTITITNEQLQMLIKGASQGATAGMTAKDLADAFAATQKKENPQAPMVSIYNPKGETDHPRPRLRTKTTQNGIALGEDTLTWEEIEALNALPPGEFRVAKANGVKIPFTVKFVKGFDGESLERVEFHYPCKDEHRHDHRPLFEYCLDVLESAGQTADVDRLRTLKREMDGLRSKTA